jgi:hypothetical protein
VSSFVNRMIRAAQLDEKLYEEVEADRGALGQAMAVVVLSSIAAGIGTFGGNLERILIGTVATLIAWLLWSFLIYLIGAKLLPEPQTDADYGQLLRTIGFSSTPGLIRILSFVPGIGGGVVFFGASVWMMAAMVVAAKRALDYQSMLRAVGVCAIGWIIHSSIIVWLLIFLERMAGPPPLP